MIFGRCVKTPEQVYFDLSAKTSSWATSLLYLTKDISYGLNCVVGGGIVTTL